MTAEFATDGPLRGVLRCDLARGPFTQEDPIGLAGGLNLYGFADGDPVNFWDPFGLMACDDDEEGNSDFNDDDDTANRRGGDPSADDEECDIDERIKAILESISQSDFGQCVAEGRRLFDAGVSELFTVALVTSLGVSNAYSRGRVGPMRIPRPFRMPGMNTTLSSAVNGGR